MGKYIPEITGKYRDFILMVPEEIYTCSGISFFGKRIKSIVFSTDVSIVRNTNADAVIAVYPFTPQPIITRALMVAADIPVFCGVGGGRTGGMRSVVLAAEAEQQGALGVVLNAPTENKTIRMISKTVDVPVIITVVNDKTDYAKRLDSGAKVFNVSAAMDTPKIVADIRRQFPTTPIIATGGPTGESILETVAAGANAITWTPPSNGEIFKKLMKKYREQ